mmetsp:Transcript_65959/g.159105  ORF Transcript_65959/g.159105 Transcript_65959/m.159105 type:complete len:652 (+) Transcript_65959:77-2032(+)
MDLGQDLVEPLVAELGAVVELEAGQKPHAGMNQRSHRTLSVQGSGKRRCQDVGALVVFLSYWVGMLWIAALASREGDLSRLTSGMDYDNRMCGEDRPGAQFKSLPFVYYACLVYGRHRPMVCVSECPTLSGHLVRWYNQSQIHCDSLGHRIPATTYPTIATARNCVPSAASLYALVASEIDDSAFMSVMAGVYKTLKWLLAASVGAMLLAACWMASVQMLGRAGCLAPVTVSAAIVALLALAVALLVRARYLGSAAFAQGVPALAGSLQVAVNTDMSIGLAILVGFLSVGVTVALWCGLLQRLMQAGGILQEAAEAAKSLPALVLLLPPLLMLGLGLLFGYYIYIALLLASAGHTTRGLMHYEHHLQLYFVYHTLGLLWTAEALLHLSFCTTSGIVVRWYFASVEPSALSAGASASPMGRAGASEVGTALLRTLRYSSGSLVLGALLVIPGRMFRFFLEHCLHQAQTDGEGKPEPLRCLTHCCLRCCLDGAARLLQYLSHNAYILVAVHDLSFCQGAKMAFELTMANIGQVALLTAGERLMLTLVKLAIACMCTSGMALAIGLHSGMVGAMDNTNGSLLLCFVACYCVADAWLGVYDAAVEAIFLCFLADREENDADARPMYASASLRKYMELHRPTYRLPTEDVSPARSR